MALSESNIRYVLKTPERKWLWKGGLAASALPVSMGILFLYFGSGFGPPHFLLSILIFLGTVIALGISIPYVIHKNKTGFKGKSSFVFIGMMSATLAHIALTILFLTYWQIIWGGVAMNVYISRFLQQNMIVLGTITLPGGALCGWIFARVAVQWTPSPPINEKEM